MKGYEIGDSIHDHRIIAEARKVSDLVVIVKECQAQSTEVSLNRNAFAVVDRNGRWCGNGPCLAYKNIFSMPLERIRNEATIA